MDKRTIRSAGLALLLALSVSLNVILLLTDVSDVPTYINIS